MELPVLVVVSAGKIGGKISGSKGSGVISGATSGNRVCCLATAFIKDNAVYESGRSTLNWQVLMKGSDDSTSPSSTLLRSALIAHAYKAELESW